ncbi:hypothetical protein F4779DRAFT_617133 [Xylariaceae sp. FL0662B]|nr:hypothetical protein F4779DRAFT_617133 [Xylariaceae sp. FL0662B]
MFSRSQRGSVITRAAHQTGLFWPGTGFLLIQRLLFIGLGKYREAGKTTSVTLVWYRLVLPAGDDATFFLAVIFFARSFARDKPLGEDDEGGGTLLDDSVSSRAHSTASS